MDLQKPKLTVNAVRSIVQKQVLTLSEQNQGKEMMRIKIKSSFSMMLVLFLLAIPCTYSWDCHFLLTYGALEHSEKISKDPKVPAETLESFLIKTRPELIHVLADNEQWFNHYIIDYPPLPANISFKNGNETTPIQIQFLQAIRVNPVMKFPLFVQYPPGTTHRMAQHPIKPEQVILPKLLKDNNSINFVNLPFEEVLPGELLSPLEIITTATDEPDYGMDVNVWENNGTWFGKVYGLGEQPFGNKTVAHSSQIPFHMGFYYESNIIYKFAPYLNRTYVEYRIHQYLSLSRFAFSTGHNYWGYRFLGWALHYAQDLTQPYHSTLSPNVSTTKLLYVNALQLMGFESSQQKIVQLLTNRHSSLENYEYYYFRHIFEANDKNNVTLQAIADTEHDKKYPDYTDNYPRAIIARESHLFESSLDNLIQEVFPSKYVSDPNYLFYQTESSVNIFRLVEGNEHLEPLNEVLNELIRNLGSHTRHIVDYATRA